MGANLMREVLNKWAPHLSDRGFRTLMRMASTAQDEPRNGTPANLYFGGREPLLNAWRIESRKGTEKSVNKELQRVINELISIGAIERTNKAYTGINQSYRLTLDGRPRIDEVPVDNSRAAKRLGGSHTPPQTGSHTPPVGGVSATYWGGPTPPPRGYIEGFRPEGQEEEAESVDLRGSVTSARASAPNEDGFISPVQCGYADCVRGWILPTDPNEPNTPCPNCNSNVIPFRRTA